MWNYHTLTMQEYRGTCYKNAHTVRQFIAKICRFDFSKSQLYDSFQLISLTHQMMAWTIMAIASLTRNW